MGRIVWLGWAAAVLSAALGSGPPPQPSGIPEPRVYRYRAHGDVRLLLFWLGRDNVGGGTITIAQRPGAAPGSWLEEIELVFGSNPERVPGRVNRWGYARETAAWERDSSGNAVLTGTSFEGLMRHSGSDSARGVIAAERAQAVRRSFEYKGITSEVTRDGSCAEIRVFCDAHEFHYSNPAPIVRRYREIRATAPVLERLTLGNRQAQFDAPFGFLAGVRTIIDSVIDAPGGASGRRSMVIVHGAVPYRLELKSLRHTAAWPGLPEAGGVAEMTFETVRLQDRRRSTFSIAAPLQGPLQGIPVRISHQPNWWLRVRLDLESAPAGARPM